MVVDTQRATESSAAARADRIRKTDNLSMGRVKRTGKRSMKRAMHEPAVRASRSVIEFGEPAVRELSGWANEWMAEVDKAEDAMDRIKRGRKAKGEEYEGLRKILGAEMMEPKGVGKKGRRSLVVAIGKAQLAAASIGEGWKKGTEIRMRRDKEVGEHRETLKTIMRAWLGYSQDRPGWKEWGRCKCETKWCTCKHVVMGQDIGTHWIWMRAWKWVSGGKEKSGIEAWRRGCEGMKWRTAVRKESGWTTSVWETKGGKDDEKKMGNREWRNWRRDRTQREADRAKEETRARRKASEGGEATGRRKWRIGEYTRFCRDTNIGMWEGVWRRAGEKTTTPKGDG